MVQGEGPLIGKVPVRLAFTHVPLRLAAGRYNYQRNLFVALHRYRPGEPVIFAGTADNSNDLEGVSAMPGVEVVRADAFDQRASRLAMAFGLGFDDAAAAAFGRQSIDGVIETAECFGWACPIRPLLGSLISSTGVCLSYFRRWRDGVATSVFVSNSIRPNNYA